LWRRGRTEPAQLRQPSPAVVKPVELAELFSCTVESGWPTTQLPGAGTTMDSQCLRAVCQRKGCARMMRHPRGAWYRREVPGGWKDRSTASRCSTVECTSSGCGSSVGTIPAVAIAVSFLRGNPLGLAPARRKTGAFPPGEFIRLIGDASSEGTHSRFQWEENRRLCCQNVPLLLLASPNLRQTLYLQNSHTLWILFILSPAKVEGNMYQER
jgi:hypothetical protein